MNDQEWVKWGVLGIAAVGFVAIVVLAVNYSSGGDLEGPTWQLSSVEVGGEVVEAVPGTPVTATFADGAVGGSGGCNTYSGSYTVDGDAITFGPIISTLIACEDPIGTQEQAYFAALGRADSFEVSGGVLTLSEGDTELASFTDAGGG
jgi:heat shock protein HslJ